MIGTTIIIFNMLKRRMKKWLARNPAIYRSAIRHGLLGNIDRLLFLQAVRRGDIVLDVGANVGDVTELLSDIVGRSGHVHAFEPVAPTYQRLLDRCSHPLCDRNLTLNNFGFSDQAGSLPIVVPSGDFGQASMVSHEAGSWGKSTDRNEYVCQVTTLDEYAKESLGRRLDFIKVDVEGAELLVLRGGVMTLRAHRPVLYLEISPQWTKGFGYAPPDLVRFLAVLGYSRFFLVQGTVFELDAPDDVGPARLSGSADLLCCPPGAAEDRLKSLLSEMPVKNKAS
jgi:FkbM family methyltransferase